MFLHDTLVLQLAMQLCEPSDVLEFVSASKLKHDKRNYINHKAVDVINKKILKDKFSIQDFVHPTDFNDKKVQIIISSYEDDIDGKQNNLSDAIIKAMKIFKDINIKSMSTMDCAKYLPTILCTPEAQVTLVAIAQKLGGELADELVEEFKNEFIQSTALTGLELLRTVLASHPAVFEDEDLKLFDTNTHEWKNINRQFINSIFTPWTMDPEQVGKF